MYRITITVGELLGLVLLLDRYQNTIPMHDHQQLSTEDTERMLSAVAWIKKLADTILQPRGSVPDAD